MCLSAKIDFEVSKSEHPSANASADLSYDTKFDLKKILELLFSDTYFSDPPHAPHGQTQKRANFHPSMVRIAASAFAELSERYFTR